MISLRDGHDQVKWMHELDEPAGGAATTTTPILPPAQPRPPQITLPGDAERDQRGSEADDQ